MARTPKKLCQSALATTATAEYTAPASTTTQITEIWLVNTNTTTVRIVTLYAHGTATANTLIQAIEIPALGTKIIDDAKIVLVAGEVLGAKQDNGNDVYMTAYGVEQV